MKDFGGHISAMGWAQRTCKELGHDFQPRVWENLGWYAAARKELGKQGFVEIRVDRDGSYQAEIQPGAAAGGRDQHGMRPMAHTLQFWGVGPTAVQALANAHGVMVEEHCRLDHHFRQATNKIQPVLVVSV